MISFKNKSILIFLFRVIPKGFISRAFGFFARANIPATVLDLIINWYCKKYGVKTDEYFIPEKGFKTFDDFFTRTLRKQLYQFDSQEGSIVSPVDARIDQFGLINDDRIIQAKGIEYSLSDLIPSQTYKEFLDGLFITLYLSPADYHRIHSPVSGNINGYFYIPGKLFTVQEYMVNGLKGLFTKNERLISYITNQHSIVGVCKIGAMNVGRISLSYSNLKTNRTFKRRTEFFYPPMDQPKILKGEELGVFHLGSTIIMLFQKNAVKFDNIDIGQRIRLGERLALFS